MLLSILGSGCGIKIPTETGLRNYHGCIKAQINPESGNTDFFFYKLVSSKYQFFHEKPKEILNTEIRLYNGSIFQTGNIKWKVSAVPKHQYILSKTFMAIRRKSLSGFSSCLEDIESWNNYINLQVSEELDQEEKNALLQKIIDINSEEDFNYSISTDVYNESNKQKDVTERFTELNKNNQYSLLHIATDFECLEFVQKLLEKGASVS